MPEAEAKAELISCISEFVTNRILTASTALVNYATQKVRAGAPGRLGGWAVGWAQGGCVGGPWVGAGGRAGGWAAEKPGRMTGWGLG